MAAAREPITSLSGIVEALFAPLQPGDEVVPGARWLATTTEAGLRLALDVDGAMVHIELAPVQAVERYAARTGHFAISYRTGTGSASRPIADDAGRALCQALAPLVARREDAVIAEVRARAARATETREGRARIRHIRGGTLLAPARWLDQPYYTLSPYVGCLIGCRFCYAQRPVAIARQLEGAPDVRWGSYVDARVDAAERLAAELASLAPAPVKFSPIVSDPYQAIERKLEITRACLEVFATRGADFPPLILTRSALITRDVDVLARIPRAWAGVSLGTLDDRVRAHMEPRAATIPERLAALKSLGAAGVNTFAIVQPQWPGPLEALADALAEHTRSVSLGVLESLEDAGEQLADASMRVAADQRWQAERREALRAALEARDVVVWDGELPPALVQPASERPTAP